MVDTPLTLILATVVASIVPKLKRLRWPEVVQLRLTRGTLYDTFYTERAETPTWTNERIVKQIHRQKGSFKRYSTPRRLHVQT